MVASTIGPGPHGMAAWLWTFSSALASSPALLAALASSTAQRAASPAERSGR